MTDFFGPEEDYALMRRQAMGEPIPDLTPGELAALEERRKMLRALFPPKIRATYKLEFLFGKERSIHTHFPGSVTIHRAGALGSGGGDEPVRACPDRQCPGIIPAALISYSLNRVVCPSCRRVYKASALGDILLYRLPYQKWATVMARFFVRLNTDADIYMKTPRESIHDSTIKEQLHNYGGELMRRERRLWVRLYYPLERIYQDLSSGADMEKTFANMLRA
jgi:hypothetical protein